MSMVISVSPGDTLMVLVFPAVQGPTVAGVFGTVMVPAGPGPVPRARSRWRNRLIHHRGRGIRRVEVESGDLHPEGAHSQRKRQVDAELTRDLHSASHRMEVQGPSGKHRARSLSKGAHRKRHRDHPEGRAHSNSVGDDRRHRARGDRVPVPWVLPEPQSREAPCSRARRPHQPSAWWHVDGDAVALNVISVNLHIMEALAIGCG